MGCPDEVGVSDPRPDPRPLVLYDGDCRFCRFAVGVLAVWDRRGRLALAPFDDPRARELLEALPESERERSLRLRDRAGDWEAGEAARRILAELPGGVLVVSLGLHRLYPAVARRRGALGRLVPNRPALRR